jgi:hypothetical protein
VHIETHEVAETMDEIRQIASASQRFLGGMLKLSHRDPGLDGGKNIFLRLIHRAIHARLLGGEMSRHGISARDI